MRDIKNYGPERAEAACRRALLIHSPTRKSVQAILRTGLDRVGLQLQPELPAIEHENVRGGDYYTTDTNTDVNAHPEPKEQDQ